MAQSGSHAESAAVLGYRSRANGLLTRGPLSGALPAGLQDSAPRAGQLSLHARVRGLVQDGWADPSLCQVWGPRGAVYLIAAADRAVFTLGRLPRDTAAADAVLDLTERVVGVLGADEVDPAVVRRALGLGEMPLRVVSRSGRLVVRWDTARITVRAVPAPTDGPVAARRELGRRFLAVFGPTDVAAFATWARISRPDAAATWLELADEVTDVTVGGRTRQLLTSRPHWWAEAPAEGMRLLPGDDPVLRLDRELLVPDPARRAVLFPRHAVGALRGALLVDGRVSGWWQRQGGRVGLHPFDRSAPWLPEAVAEARTLPVPGGITVVDVVDA